MESKYHYLLIQSFNLEKRHKINKKFYTSGLGGIYPADIKIGEVVNIKDISATRKDIEIKLLADPVESNFFGVLLE